MSIRFSPYGKASVWPSPVNAMMASAAADFRPDVDLNLGVGYVNDATIPKDLLVEGVATVARDAERHGMAFNYGRPAGSTNLVEALQGYYAAQAVGELDAATLARKQWLIGGGGATSLLDGLASVLEPGLVVTADPMYYIYTNALERQGYEMLAVPEDADGVDPDRLRAKLEALGPARRDIAFFYFVGVNNPSGAVLSNERREALVRIAHEVSAEAGRTIPFVFDTAYDWLHHTPQGDPLQSPMLWDTDGLVYEVGTLSKVVSPALRLGHVFGPPGALMDAWTQCASDVGLCPAPLNQEVAAWFVEHHLAKQVARVSSAYRERSAAVRQAIDTHLAPHIETMTGGEAGFYYYLTLRDVETYDTSAFFQRATRNTGDATWDTPGGEIAPRVVYLPGNYCVHAHGDLAETGRRQLRLSYGYESAERVARGIELLAEAMR